MKTVVNKAIENRNKQNPLLSSWNFACINLGFRQDSNEVILGNLLTKHEYFNNTKNQYHNELHASDAIICASELVKSEFTEDIQSNGFLLIMAMLFHDIEHNGQNNKHDYELEKIAVASMNNFIGNNQVSSFWNKNLKGKYGDLLDFSKKIEQIILGTDFKVGILKNIQEYSQDNVLSRLKMLANEADIFMSCSAEMGPILGRNLALEQRNINVGTWQGRVFFLKNLAKFTSEASNKLKINNDINIQIMAIENLKIKELDDNILSMPFEMIDKIVYNEYIILSNLDNKKQFKL